MLKPHAKPFLLWDIDGTLILGSHPAIEAFNTALRHVYRLTDIPPLATAGKTDSQIVRETLVQRAIDPAVIDAGLADFHACYTDECRQRLPQLQQSVRVLAGVVKTLTALKAQAHHGLLTGNLRTTAHFKLHAAKLDQWFDWDMSAFGSDHEHRNALVPIALERAHQAGHRITHQQTVVIGDTPSDIACARAGGVRVVAVATGRFSRAELAAHQPDALLDDLNDPQRLMAALL